MSPSAPLQDAVVGTETRLGVLVPEFPGQTHGFFLRENRALVALGADCAWLSTRPPRGGPAPHEWAAGVAAQTHYLMPPAFGSIGVILRSGPIGIARVVRALARARVPGLRQRLRLVAIAIAGAALVRTAAKAGVEHVHVHSCGDAAHVAMFAHLWSGLPYSLTLHGDLEHYGPNQAEKWRHAAFVIVITQRLLGEAREQLAGSLPSEIIVAPMGVEPETFRRSAPYVPRREGETLRVFSCARLHPSKGHDDLIRAVALLRERGTPVALEIAGGESATGECRADLEALIAELDVGEQVQLLGSISEDQVRARLEAAHVFALASHAEPLGVAIMEAMAMLAPVVTTAAGGVLELVSRDEDGLLVPPRDPQALADALARIADDPALAERLSAAGRRKIEREFSSEVSARALLAGIAAARARRNDAHR